MWGSLLRKDERMNVSKGDKVSFVPENTSGEDARLARIGIVKSQQGYWVDLLCAGENLFTNTDGRPCLNAAEQCVICRFR